MRPKIEKNVPVPGPWINAPRWAPTLRKMVPGDSVVLPIDTKNAWACAKQIFGKGNFICRKVDGGTRIWRLL